MLEKLKYKNHINEVFEFGKAGIYVNENDLRDFVWSVTSKNNKISAFDRGVTTKTLPVTIIRETEAMAVEAKNKLFEIAEKDVLANQHGRIIIGDYYLKCFVTASKKSSYLKSKRLLEVKLTITTDFPYWIKETSYNFGTPDAVQGGGKNLDYPFDYPHDYASTVGNKTLINSNFVPSNFRMQIHGACQNPVVFIGGHAYRVNCAVEAGEYLTIDSVDKKIYLTANNGAVVNVFNLRDRDSYIFEKIPSGGSQVLWAGDFGITITLLEERSEPKWT